MHDLIEVLASLQGELPVDVRWNSLTERPRIRIGPFSVSVDNLETVEAIGIALVNEAHRIRRDLRDRDANRLDGIVA